MSKVYKQFEMIDFIEQKLPEEERYTLMKRVIQGEDLLAYVEDESDKNEVLDSLTRDYDILDRILGTTISMMGYSEHINQWNDTLPLGVMMEALPEIQESNWYKNKMEQVFYV